MEPIMEEKMEGYERGGEGHPTSEKKQLTRGQKVEAGYFICGEYVKVGYATCKYPKTSQKKYSNKNQQWKNVGHIK